MKRISQWMILFVFSITTLKAQSSADKKMEKELLGCWIFQGYEMRINENIKNPETRKGLEEALESLKKTLPNADMLKNNEAFVIEKDGTVKVLLAKSKPPLEKKGTWKISEGYLLLKIVDFGDLLNQVYPEVKGNMMYWIMIHPGGQFNEKTDIQMMMVLKKGTEKDLAYTLK